MYLEMYPIYISRYIDIAPAVRYSDAADDSEKISAFLVKDLRVRCLMLNGTENSALTELASEMTVRYYDKGYILYTPGDPSDCLFLMKAGRVQQYHLSPDGRKLITSILGPGDIFGTTALAKVSRHHLFAEALDECAILALPRRRAQELLLRKPKAILILIDRLGRRLGHIQDKMQALAFEPIAVRLARCLIETADNGIVEGYSHQELSEIVGAYRESVTATLNHFKGEELVDIERRRIKVLNVAGLKRVANGHNGSRPAAGTPKRVAPARPRSSTVA